MQAVTDAGYTVPTPIQGMAIQPILQAKDLLGIAQTGTGKTAAFALPIMQRLAADKKQAPRKGCRVLVLSPTRELSTQIAETFRTLGKHLGITVAVVFGGVAHRPQIQALAHGVDVLVATPGRLLDHVAERHANLGATEIFVLDEADQMLDLGFFKPIRRIVAQLPSKRQSLFFSATMPGEIEALTKELLVDPAKVAVTPTATTVELIDQRVILIEANRKRALLVELLADAAMSRTLIFTRTKRGADRVAKHLDGAGISVAAIHGNKSQRQREDALEAFRDGNIRVLVATDIAARGIDIDKVSHVINFEIPEVPEAYVHRIGRTARAGASGIAISLVAGDERGLLRDIERLTRQTIASTDRRNDTGLEADQASAEQGRSERGRSERGRPQRHGQARSERGTRDGGRNRPKFERGDRSAPRAEGPGTERSGQAEATRAAGQPAHRGHDRLRKDGESRPREGRPQQGRPHQGRPDRPRGEGRNAGPGSERAPQNGFDRRRDEGDARPHTTRPHTGRPQFGRDDKRPHHGGEHRPRGEDRGERRHERQGGQNYWDTGIVNREARGQGPQGERDGNREHRGRPARGGDERRSNGTGHGHANGHGHHGPRPHGERPHGARQGERADKPRSAPPAGRHAGPDAAREGRPQQGRKQDGNGQAATGRPEHRGRDGGGRPWRPREGGPRDRKPAREA